MFRDTDRQIVGARSGRVFKMGQRVHVLLDRIDRQQRRLQFALLPGEGEQQVARGMGSLRSGKKKAAAVGEDGRVVHQFAGSFWEGEKIEGREDEGQGAIAG